MEIRLQILINRRQGSSSNTSIRSFQRQPSSLPRFRRRRTAMRARRIGSSKSRITDYRQRKMLRQRKTLSLIWLNSQFRRMRKSMSWTPSGAKPSKKLSFSPSRSWRSLSSTITRTSERASNVMAAVPDSICSVLTFIRIFWQIEITKTKLI